MAVGDFVMAHQSVANNSFLTARPASGAEWAIREIWGAGNLEVYRSDGAREVEVGALTGSAYELGGLLLLVTNGVYVKIKNVSGGTVYLGYAARQTR